MQHFALNGNVADLSAKEGSQETAVTLIGMIGGACVVEAIDGPARVKWTWTIFLLLTFVHVYANWRGVRGLILRTLNTQRTHAIIHAFLDKTNKGPSSNDKKNKKTTMNSFDRLSPESIAAVERLFWCDRSGLKMGANLHSTIRGTQHLEQLIRAHESRKSRIEASSDSFAYLIVPSIVDGTPRIDILLAHDSNDISLLRATFHGIVLYELLRPVDPSSSIVDDSNLLMTHLEESTRFVEQHFDTFYERIDQLGWQTERILIETCDWRYDREEMRRYAQRVHNEDAERIEAFVTAM